MRRKFKELGKTVSDKTVSLLLACLAFGVLTGVFAVVNSSFLLTGTQLIFTDFLDSMTSGFLNSFVSYGLGCLPYLIVITFMGLCAIGSPFIYLTVTVSGFYYGMLIGYIYSVYRFYGVLFNLVVLLLPALAYFMVLLFIARESLRFSGNIFRMICHDDNHNAVSGDLSLYLFRIFVFTLFMMCTCLLKTLFYNFLGNLSIFNFR